jgi:hypothetical protein
MDTPRSFHASPAEAYAKLGIRSRTQPAARLGQS